MGFHDEGCNVEPGPEITFLSKLLKHFPVTLKRKTLLVVTSPSKPVLCRDVKEQRTDNVDTDLFRELRKKVYKFLDLANVVQSSDTPGCVCHFYFSESPHSQLSVCGSLLTS